MSELGLSWDAIHKMTKLEPEIIPNSDMYIFFEKSIRGEISYISATYSKANKKYLKFDNPKEESKHIIPLGANNPHDYAMPKFLPASEFKWIDPKEIEFNKYTINNLKRCVLVVDVEYSKELRELHNNYPLAVDKIEIKREVVSEYPLKIAHLFNITIGIVKKLMPNFLIKKGMCFIIKTCNFT